VVITNIYVNEKKTLDQHCGKWSVWQFRNSRTVFNFWWQESAV